MGKFNGCVLACDIDGTLMESNFINPKNIEKINYFMSEGGMFSLSTGRTVAAVYPVINKLNKVSSSVVANGCMVYDYVNKKSLYELFVPDNEKHTVKTVFEKYSKIGIEMHLGAQVYAIRRTSESDDHQNYEDLTAIDISVDEAMKLPWNKIVMFLNDDIENAENIENELSKIIVDSKLVNTTAVINGVKRHYLEQLPKGVSKATALNELCRIYNISEDKLFAIGDYYNDLEMIEMAKIGATTIDAPDDIKAKAEYITCNCADGAVADFIDYLDSVI